MPVKRRTINLSVNSNSLAATDAQTGLPTSDAGLQGEDGAVWLHAEIPGDWSDLSARLQVMAASGECDESGLPLAGEIDMPLRNSVTVPGRLTVTLKGYSPDGVRRTAECRTLTVKSVDCPLDPVSQIYPMAFENLCNEVEKGVVHKITGSGGAKVTKTGDTTYDINVTGTGGDMLQANYVSGAGVENQNTIDHAAYADKTGAVDSAAHADIADVAKSAASAQAGSALEAAISSKQAALSAGANGGVDLLSGNTVKSIKGNGLTVTSDNSSVTLGLDGSLVTTGMIMYFAKPTRPAGWEICDGHEVKIADDLDLYKMVGTTYGKGTTGYILVTPNYLTDNVDFADDIILQKYTNSIQPVNYFAANGTIFTGDDFKVTVAGDYTVYCKDSKGREAVQYAHIAGAKAPYILNTTSYPITGDFKLQIFADSNGETSTINLVKIASGIQPNIYFLSAGTQIGTADNCSCTFQEGTAFPSGIYTWYTKDAAGNEALQYYNVVADKTLAMSLFIDYGTDYFKLPNFVGTINNCLCPCIKV